MANLNEVFNTQDYRSAEARKLKICQTLPVLVDFVHGLKQRKSTVYSAIMTEQIVGFNGVVTLSSLLLQVNLYCRKNNSLMLLKQLKADELTEAIQSFYVGTYVEMTNYAKFIKEIFHCLQ